MSFCLTCPNCGARDVSEFRYGGQILPAHEVYRYGGLKPEGAPAASGNLPEVHKERWYHRLGCRRWLVAERNVQTNTVTSTGWLDEEAS